MLRGRSNPESAAGEVPPTPASADNLPATVDQPYRTGERPAGIIFTQGPTSFWLPYHLLQAMRYEPDKLTLVFASADVLIEGRGLHGLYLELARQVVSQIIEQGARYAELSDAPTCISGIIELPKGKETASPED